MLYEVPGAADDDWYWIYATVYKGRKTHAYVITNDHMRDHRLAFLEPKPFYLWRESHILHFDLIYDTEKRSLCPAVIFKEPGINFFPLFSINNRC